LQNKNKNKKNTTTDACQYICGCAIYIFIHADISSHTHTHLANMLIVRGSLSWERMCIGKLLATVGIVGYLVVFDLGPHFLIQESQISTILALIAEAFHHTRDALHRVLYIKYTCNVERMFSFSRGCGNTRYISSMIAHYVNEMQQQTTSRAPPHVH